VVICHFPSQYGGAASAPKRQAAVACLKALTDSLAASGATDILVLGDWNDTPEKPVFAPLSPSLVNLALPAARRGEGTIRYQGRWELIDQAWASPSLSERSRFRVVRIPFLTERDPAHPGEKPLRTWSGPRYRGGVSDHLPILVKIEDKSE
jgi:endonuclease/exonuclease/phosphatase family metal-dependent hydrolase